MTDSTQPPRLKPRVWYERGTNNKLERVARGNKGFFWAVKEEGGYREVARQERELK